MNKIDLKHLTSYEEDFALWAAEQGALIRAGKVDRIDLENVAEEIESLARSQKYQIDHRLEVLLTRLLKWQFQPQKRSNSWRATIYEQRYRIAREIEDSPSLKHYPATVVAGSYTLGLNEAITQTGLAETTFPPTCPWSVDQVLDQNFLPGGSEAGEAAD